MGNVSRTQHSRLSFSLPVPTCMLTCLSPEQTSQKQNSRNFKTYTEPKLPDGSLPVTRNHQQTLFRMHRTFQMLGFVRSIPSTLGDLDVSLLITAEILFPIVGTMVATAKTFIHNHSPTMDFCQHPSLKKLHGAMRLVVSACITR